MWDYTIYKVSKKQSIVSDILHHLTHNPITKGRGWGRENIKMTAYARKFTVKKNKHPLWELLYATQHRIIAHKPRLHKHSNKTQSLIDGSSLSGAYFHRAKAQPAGPAALQSQVPHHLFSSRRAQCAASCPAFLSVLCAGTWEQQTKRWLKTPQMSPSSLKAEIVSFPLNVHSSNLQCSPSLLPPYKPCHY